MLLWWHGIQVGSELVGVLSAEEVEGLTVAPSPPTYCLTAMRFWVHKMMHDEYAGMAYPNDVIMHHDRVKDLESHWAWLARDYAGCQRIATTPMPFSYLVHLRSFLVLWLLALPLVFTPTLGWWCIAACLGIGYQLLGFEGIGVEIEDPFGHDYNDLPLDSITRELRETVERGVLAVRAQAADPGPDMPSSSGRKAPSPQGSMASVPEDEPAPHAPPAACT